MAERKKLQFGLSGLLRAYFVVAGILVAVILFTATAISQREFSPNSLELRGRSILHSHVLNRNILRGRWSFSRPRIVNYLISKRLWKVKSVEAQQKWIRAPYLSRELFGNDRRWVVWSDVNPKLASVVWPTVLDSIRSKRYGVDVDIAATIILDHGKEAHDVDDFIKRVQSDHRLKAIERETLIAGETS